MYIFQETSTISRFLYEFSKKTLLFLWICILLSGSVIHPAAVLGLTFFWYFQLYKHHRSCMYKCGGHQILKLPTTNDTEIFSFISWQWLQIDSQITSQVYVKCIFMSVTVPHLVQSLSNHLYNIDCKFL